MPRCRLGFTFYDERPGINYSMSHISRVLAGYGVYNCQWNSNAWEVMWKAVEGSV